MKKLITLFFTMVMIFGISTTAHAQYYVKQGDTMSYIAKLHQMSLQDLISLNPHIKNPNVIKPNDFIVIRSKTNTKKDMTEFARSLQDITVYVYGGQNFPYQTDCSGFAQGVFKKFGVDLPRVSRDQARTGTPIKFQDLQLGDLMFFSTLADKTITHVGIYLGDGFWISNLNSEKGVEVLSSWGSWTQKYFLWGTRYTM